MQPYRFEFVHLKGEANKVADALSHTPEFECHAVEIYAAAPLYLEDSDRGSKEGSHVCHASGGERMRVQKGGWLMEVS